MFSTTALARLASQDDGFFGFLPSSIKQSGNSLPWTNKQTDRSGGPLFDQPVAIRQAEFICQEKDGSAINKVLRILFLFAGENIGLLTQLIKFIQSARASSNASDGPEQTKVIILPSIPAI